MVGVAVAGVPVGVAGAVPVGVAVAGVLGDVATGVPVPVEVAVPGTAVPGVGPAPPYTVFSWTSPKAPATPGSKGAGARRRLRVPQPPGCPAW